jgi:hypothetical protein
MAEYKGIKGFKVQYLDQDPVPTVAGWSSGTSMPIVKDNFGAAGTQTASIAFGGGSPYPDAVKTITYDGSTWTLGGDMSTQRAGLGSATAGTTSSALAFGGLIGGSANTNDTEEYNGTSWTAGGALPGTTRRGNYGAGTQTAALSFGGGITSGFTNPAIASTDEYDGSTWTAGGNLGTARWYLAGCGLQTAGLAVGGSSGANPPAVIEDKTEEYNGTSWTAGGALSSTRIYLGMAGIQTAALAFGGSVPPTVATTDQYNGSTWTTVSSLAVARTNLRGSGTITAALAAGGGSPATQTEEYNDYSPYTNTFENVGQVWYNGTTKALKFTDETFSSAWATGNNMNTARNNLGGVGIQTAALAFGGYNSTK